MTKTKQKSENFAQCCAGFEASSCCEQLRKMMQPFCGAEKGGFDCLAMLQKMGVGPEAKGEQPE